MLCPKCHTPNRDNAKFCKGCGLAFTPEILAAATQPVETAQAEAAQVQSTPSQDSLDHATPVSVPPPQDLTEAETQQAPANGTKSRVEDDIALAPTQILTPQQMMAYHAKRWQQELEREQRVAQASSGEQEQPDIADAPTMLFTPSNAQQDIADMPTILVPPVSSDTNEPAPVPPPPPPESLVPVSDATDAPSQAESAPETSTTDTSASAATSNAASTEVATNTTTAQTSSTDEVAGQEDAMEQLTPTSGGQPEQDQAQTPSEAQPAQTTDTSAQETSTSFQSWPSEQ